MSKEDIFQYFYTNSANLGTRSIILTLLAGVLIGAIIFSTYRITYKGVAYNVKFNVSLVVIQLISIVIMLMISSNIVISLGMVGALSIVRFRTAIKDSRDTVYIFWAIAEGLSVGSQNFQLALVTTLFIAVVLILMQYLPNSQNKYLIVVTGNDIDIEGLTAEVEKSTKDCKLRTANKSEARQEYVFEVICKRGLPTKAVDSIYSVDGVKSVNWISETGESIG